jgi:hypothetical protein
MAYVGQKFQKIVHMSAGPAQQLRFVSAHDTGIQTGFLQSIEVQRTLSASFLQGDF